MSIDEHKLNVNGSAGRRDTFLIETLDQPLTGIEQALIIADGMKFCYLGPPESVYIF